MTAAQQLHQALVDAGLKVRQYPGWETRGGSWAHRKPVGVMHHHTAAPVPFPVSRLAGSLIKCNINTKPDGTVWLVAYGACNYSSGSGSSKVLAEVRAGTPPTRNARDRDLDDNVNGNPHFWNFENDHAGKGGPLPAVQEEAIVVATRVTNDHFELSGRNMISHACWTARKHDPYWNGNRRAIDDIRNLLEDDMFTPHETDTLKQVVDGLDEAESNGKAIKYGVLHLRQKGIHWTRTQIASIAAGSAAAGAGASEVIEEIVRRLG